MRRLPLRKGLGQHHLRQPALCRPLVDYLRPEPDGRVLEIGVGGGVLTRALVEAGAHVIGCELDPVWALRARRELGAEVSLWVGDALQIEWGRIPSGWLVCGNLPYNVATPILGRLLESAAGFPRAGFLLQLEVARRLTAAPGEPDYGALSVWTAACVDCRLLRRVRAGSFVPPPRVESAFVGWQPRPAPVEPEQMSALRELIYAAFVHRRKTLRAGLGKRWGRDLAIARLEAAGIDSGRRAESLDLADFVRLHHAAREP